MEEEKIKLVIDKYAKEQREYLEQIRQQQINRLTLINTFGVCLMLTVFIIALLY